MKDILGNQFEVGDHVATDVVVNKTSGLRIGVVTEANTHSVKVSYKLKTWDNKVVNRSVWRFHAGVVKVATDGIQT